MTSRRQDDRKENYCKRGLDALVLLTAACIFIPFTPTMPTYGLDPSWKFGVNQAVGQGLAFGREIIFTYGPYAAIATHTYHPATDLMSLVGGLHLAVCFWVALLHITRSADLRKRTMLLISIVALAYSNEAVLITVVVLIGATVCLIPREGPNQALSHWKVALLFSALGLLPLIKASFELLTILVLAIAAAVKLRSGEWRAIPGMLLASLVTMVGYWLACGQAVINLPEYFRASWPLIQGYSAAMTRDGPVHEVILYLAASGLVLGITYREFRPRSPGFLLLCLGSVFFVFKASFVRHDTHSAVAASFLIFLYALVWCLLPVVHDHRQKLRLALAFSILLFLSATPMHMADHQDIRGLLDKTLAAKGMETAAFVQRFLSSTGGQKLQLVLDTFEPGELRGLLWQSVYFPVSYPSLWQGFADRILNRGVLEQRYEQSLQALRVKRSVPLVSGSVDTYSFNQSYLFASGNQWSPRPVFQSYTVYTPSLANTNYQHLVSATAPDHLFFEIAPIDNHWPSMEDGASWPAVLHRYRPTGFTQGFVHLQKRNPAPEVSPIVPGSTTRASFGDYVAVPRGEGMVYVRLHIEPTLSGRLLNMFYKPASLEIKLQLLDGTTRIYRLVPGMTAMSIPLSPLVETTQEFASLYDDRTRLNAKLVQAFSVRSNSRWLESWLPQFDIEFLLDAM